VKIVDTVEPETGLVEKYEKRYQVLSRLSCNEGIVSVGDVKRPAFRKEGVEYQGVSIGRGMLTPFYTKKLYEFRLEKLQF
jgi:hypothetical protein